MRSHLLNPNSSQYVWDAIWQTDRYANPLERRQRALKRAAAFDLKLLLTAKKFVLDVGCGTGDLLNVIETQNPNLTLYGVDRSATALRLGASRNPNSNVKFVVGAAELLPFAKGQFDAVFLFGVLEHMQDFRLALQELHRVMRIGGVACLSSSNAGSTLQIRNRLLASFGRYRYGYQYNWTIADLRGELESLFKIQRQFVMHADADMKVVAGLDRAISCLVPSWGRYICFVIQKCL